MAVVIIEGPDCAGKTTLIKHIQEQFPGLVELSPASRMTSEQRNSSNFRDPYAVHERVIGGIVEAIHGQNKVQIHDRLFFSELVYGEVLRGRSCFSWAEQVHICRLLTAISPPIVFCLPPLEAIHAKILGSTQMEGATERIDAIYNKYLALSSLRHPRITKYDYTRGPAAKARICGVIRAYMERRDKRTWRL